MNPFSAIESRLAGLVHPQNRGEPEERDRHVRFLHARLASGALALALTPSLLLWRGAPSPAEHLVLAAMAAPLLAAAVLARTGRLALAQGIVTAGLAAPAAGLWALGVSPAAALLALLTLPAEALLSGSRRAAVAAAVLAATLAVAVALIGPVGPGGEPPPAWFLVPALGLALAGHGMAALARLRGRAIRQVAAPAADRFGLRVIDDLVTWHDRDGHVVEASPASSKLLGVAPAALGGRGLFGRVHVSDRPAFLRAISEAAHGGRAVARFRVHAGSGGAEPGKGDAAAARVLWVEMRAHRTEPAAGTLAAVVAVTRDVSERQREMEALEFALKQAERLDLSKSRFLATVSHELRTPLNAIIGFSDILHGDGPAASDGAKRREYAGIIRDSGRHLLDVVNTLLDMSKIETGNFPFTPEPFDISNLVGGCCELMSLRAEAAGVSLSRTIAADLPELVADRRACRQILINLLSNAIKFTPEGGEARVEVARDRDRIVLVVSDTGRGVTEADLPRLGDPFFQAGQTYDRSHEGTGLGLTVVRGLVGLHRGSLSIESAPGEGTRVTVALPLDCRTPAGSTVSVIALPRPRRQVLAKVG